MMYREFFFSTTHVVLLLRIQKGSLRSVFILVLIYQTKCMSKLFCFTILEKILILPFLYRVDIFRRVPINTHCLGKT